MSLPEEFGATGWLGEDGTPEQAGAALVRRFGRGCYSDDLDSLHGLRCLALATAFGTAKADDYAILENAYPDTAIDLLSEWETQLGLTPALPDYTTEDRWTRLLARCREARGNNPAMLAVVFSLLVGSAAVYVREVDAASVNWSYNRFKVAIALPLSIWGTALWDECEIVRTRIEPAHGRIYLCCTFESISKDPEFRTDESLTDRDVCRAL